ncbi:MAG TPA: AAA family ATPase [Thermoanaerobaculia bacterium]|jgi:predicted ATPase|nr:AAA family ATPase [Thermoanaerobaculia bacterium]
MRRLESLTVRNFKSIRDQTLHLAALNIFIGGNGSGKSNLIEVFRFLREIVNQNLAGYTARKGGADALLHFGRKTSPTMDVRVEFADSPKVSNAYRVGLTGTNEDQLVIENETAYFHEKAHYKGPYIHPVTQFAAESKLRGDAHISARQILQDLESYWVYHFHDTSDSAPLKATNDVDDNRFLRPQAENLAAFLYWLQEKHPDHMANIRDTVRQIAPFFDRFQLAPLRLNPSKIKLEWQEKGTDSYFNASAMSDGTLRFICLATLLLQPTLPPLVLLDEPELGLHPAAITLLANLLASAATRTQVMVATQSVTLVNQFEPTQVWTVDRSGHESVFRHLSEAGMAGWLDDYALGELWEKNVLGARP